MLLSVAQSYPFREQADPSVIDTEPHPDAALLTGASFPVCPAAAERGPALKRQHIAFLSEEEEEEDGIPTQVSLISQDGTQQVQRPGGPLEFRVQLTELVTASNSHTRSLSSWTAVGAFPLPLDRRGRSLARIGVCDVGRASS